MTAGDTDDITVCKNTTHRGSHRRVALQINVIHLFGNQLHVTAQLEDHKNKNGTNNKTR